MDVTEVRVLHPVEQEMFRLALEKLAACKEDKTYSAAARSALEQKMYERLLWAK